MIGTNFPPHILALVSYCLDSNILTLAVLNLFPKR